MDIVGALDLHRGQITFRWDDMTTGEIHRGHIVPTARDSVRDWLTRFRGRDGDFVLEATTGWRFVVEELVAAGLTAHLAEPAETASKRGRKRRAKTDRIDCDHMVKLLRNHDLPESWIPPDHVLEWRTLVRLHKTLVDERGEWQQRIHALLFHHGVPPGIKLHTVAGRARLAEVAVPPSARTVIDAGLSTIDHLDARLRPLDRRIRAISSRQPGCRTLRSELYGVGSLISLAIISELGDCRRFRSSQQPVRYAGIDVTVYSSDTKRSPGVLSHQGPGVLRWALFEAAQCGARRGSPDRHYFANVRDRIDHNRAALALSRKLVRRAYHLLRELGDEALAPVDEESLGLAA
jgi:transposase